MQINNIPLFCCLFAGISPSCHALSYKDLIFLAEKLHIKIIEKSELSFISEKCCELSDERLAEIIPENELEICGLKKFICLFDEALYSNSLEQLKSLLDLAPDYFVVYSNFLIDGNCGSEKKINLINVLSKFFSSLTKSEIYTLQKNYGIIYDIFKINNIEDVLKANKIERKIVFQYRLQDIANENYFANGLITELVYKILNETIVNDYSGNSDPANFCADFLTAKNDIGQAYLDNFINNIQFMEVRPDPIFPSRSDIINNPNKIELNYPLFSSSINQEKLNKFLHDSVQKEDLLFRINEKIKSLRYFIISEMQLSHEQFFVIPNLTSILLYAKNISSNNEMNTQIDIILSSSSMEVLNSRKYNDVEVSCIFQIKNLLDIYNRIDTAIKQ